MKRRLFAGLAAAWIASAGQAQEPRGGAISIPPIHEAISREAARERSRGRVLLQIGEGFADLRARSLASLLTEKGYPTDIYRGGPTGNLRLYIDGREGQNTFTPSAASQYLITVVERAGQNLRTR